MSNYLSLPGASGEYASVPDTNLLDADTAHLQQSVGWWGASPNVIPQTPSLVADSTTAFGNNALTFDTPGASPNEGVGGDPVTLTGGTYSVAMQVKATAGSDLKLVVRPDAGAADVAFVATGDWQWVESTGFTVTTTLADIALRTNTSAQALTDVRIGAVVLRSGSDATFVPSLRIVGDLDLRAKVANYDLAARRSIIYANDNSGPNYTLDVLTTGKYRFVVEDSASGQRYYDSSVAGTTDTGPVEVRATLDVSVPAWTFYEDGVQLGSVGATVVVGSALQSGPADVWIGNDAGVHMGKGVIYWSEIRDGIDGPVVCRTDFTDLTGAELVANEFETDEGHTATLNGDEWAYVRPVETGILSRAELVLQADDGNEGGSAKWADRSGNGHHAQLGSAAGADTNDPEYLAHSGDDYVRLPGVSGNYVDTPDVNLLDADTAHLQQSAAHWRNYDNTDGGTLTADDGAFFGDNVLRVVGDGTGEMGINSGAALVALLPLSASTEHTFSAYLASPDTLKAKITLQSWTAAGVYEGQAVGSYVNLGATATQVSVTGTTTANAAYAVIIVQALQQDGSDPANGDLFDLSASCLRTGSDSTFVPSLRIVGDLDMRAKFSMTDPTPTATSSIISKYIGSDGNREYWWYVATSGAISLYWTEDLLAATGHTLTSSVSGVASTDPVEIRTTLDVDDGAGDCIATFYKDDVQVGTPQALGATSNLPGNGPQPVAVGARSTGNNPIDGSVLWSEIRDGIDGPVVARYDAADAEEPFATQTGEADGRTWTYNRSGSGLYVVDRPAWGYDGTDDYHRIADHADLDFAAADPGTIIVAARKNDYSGLNILAAKRLSTEGWMLYENADGSMASYIRDNLVTSDIEAVLFNDRTTYAFAGSWGPQTTGSTYAYLDGVPSTGETRDAGDSTNAHDVFIGSLYGTSSYFDGEVFAVAVFREQLTDDEILEAGKALAGPNKTDALGLHKQPLHTWILGNDPSAAGSKLALVGLLNDLAGTTRLEYRKARRRYLGLE